VASCVKYFEYSNSFSFGAIHYAILLLDASNSMNGLLLLFAL
jgi:hypothetical protein